MATQILEWSCHVLWIVDNSPVLSSSTQVGVVNCLHHAASLQRSRQLEIFRHFVITCSFWPFWPPLRWLCILICLMENFLNVRLRLTLQQLLRLGRVMPDTANGVQQQISNRKKITRFGPHTSTIVSWVILVPCEIWFDVRWSKLSSCCEHHGAGIRPHCEGGLWAGPVSKQSFSVWFSFGQRSEHAQQEWHSKFWCSRQKSREGKLICSQPKCSIARTWNALCLDESGFSVKLKILLNSSGFNPWGVEGCVLSCFVPKVTH